MIFLYNIGIRCFYWAVRLAAPFNRKADLWEKGRKGQFSKIQNELADVKQVIWIHAASLGEFEQGRPLIEKWKEYFPGSKIVLTFFSPSGYEIRKNYDKADFVYYLPLDTRKNARHFMQLVRPKYAIFIKYEFWYHFLHEAKKSGAKLLLISANFRSNQVFFRPWGGLYRKMLFFFDHIFVQDEKSLRLLEKFKSLKVSIAGDTRFDRVAEIAKDSKSLDIAEKFARGRFTFIIGSSWANDEDLIIRYINESPSQACFIIAPHEIIPRHIDQIVKRLHKQVMLYSQAAGKEVGKADVLIIDNIGLLSSLYRYGNVAYIGGGFRKGIHNILEPSVYGMPLVFGPRYHKYREAVELVNEKGAYPVHSYQEIKCVFNSLMKDSEKHKASSLATQKFVQRNLGATRVILNFLKSSSDGVSRE
jgi:3-deoxy-D-manno-octulosonic-acid transferase